MQNSEKKYIDSPKFAFLLETRTIGLLQGIRNYNSENRMCHLAKQKSSKANVSNLFPAKVYFRETYKSQNIDPISPTPKFSLGIMQIKIKSISTMFSVVNSINKKLICTISISDFNLTQKSGVCKVKVFASMLVYDYFPLI